MGDMRSNNALEGTVNRGGRTARAAALCAQAGAEMQSWPAVQHNC